MPLLIPLGYAYYYAEPSLEPITWVVVAMMTPSLPVLIPGIFKWIFSLLASTYNFLFRREAHWNYALNVLTKRPELSELKFGDILAISAISWIIIPIIGAYPFYMSGMGAVDSVFESMSGWTSTGLSTITSFENIPNSLILYRSVIQWVGGLGIVLLMLSLLRNRQAKNLLASEAKDEMEIGPQKTASKIWKIYIGLTMVAIALVYLSGFELFEAVNLGFAGLSNGGYFPFMAYEMVWIQKLILALTMFLGAVSFVTYNKLLNGKMSALLAQEFLLFVFLIVAGVLLISTVGQDEFHNTLLNTVSAIACGGFAIGDLSVMHEFSIYVLIILMICGGMYGSTTGGLKLWRILVALKLIVARIKSYFLPIGTVQIIKMDGNTVSQSAMTEVMGYIFMYITVFLISAGIFMAWGHGIVDSMFIIASAMGNVGLSTLGIATLPEYAKIFLACLMFIGRIEIFPVLAMFRFMIGGK